MTIPHFMGLETMIKLELIIEIVTLCFQMEN